MFIVKDQDFMGVTNEFVSETFVHFKDIPSTQLENDLGSVPQIKLKLTSPKSLGNYQQINFLYFIRTLCRMGINIVINMYLFY